MSNSALCFDFTQGRCNRGNKCKYSHEYDSAPHSKTSNQDQTTNALTISHAEAKEVSNILRLIPRDPCKISFDFILKNEYEAFMSNKGRNSPDEAIFLCPEVGSYNPYISRFASMHEVIEECYLLSGQHREVMKLLNHHHLKKGKQRDTRFMIIITPNNFQK